MVAEAEVVTARLGERKEVEKSVVRVGANRSKNTVSACSQRVWMDRGGGTELPSRCSIENFLQHVPVRGENGSPPTRGGICEARYQRGSECYGKLGRGEAKRFEFLRGYGDCAARCTDGVTWGEKVRQGSINTPKKLRISTRVKPGGRGGTEEAGGGRVRAE